MTELGITCLQTVLGVMHYKSTMLHLYFMQQKAVLSWATSLLQK